MCARFTVLSDTPIAAAIAGWAIPLSRNNTIWMRWRCAAGIFQRNAVFNRRTSALLHLTICFPLRSRRTAECDQQFPPSDGDCHTPLPCEVRRNGTTPRPAWGPVSASASYGGFIPSARLGLSASQRAGEGLTPICPHCTQSRRSLWPRGDYLMGTDRLSAPSECRAQALHCRMVADTGTDEQVRTLWI